MLHRRALPSMLILAALLAAPAFAQEMRGFTTEIALDVKSPRIVAMSEDGRRIAVTVRTRRGRADVDHARFGDPTYVSPSLVTALVIDTRSGDRVWLHEQFAAVGGDYALEIHVTGEAFLTPPGDLSTLIAHAVEAATGRVPELSTTGGTSDARFIKDFCPVAEFGMISETAHKVDEKVAISDIAMLCDIYEAVLDGYFTP